MSSLDSFEQGIDHVPSLQETLDDFHKVYNSIKNNNIEGFSVSEISYVFGTGTDQYIKFGNTHICCAERYNEFTGTRTVKFRIYMDNDTMPVGEDWECLQILQSIMPKLKEKCLVISGKDKITKRIAQELLSI